MLRCACLYVGALVYALVNSLTDSRVLMDNRSWGTGDHNHDRARKHDRMYFLTCGIQVNAPMLDAL